MVSISIYLSRKRTFEKIKWFAVYEVSDLMLERVLKVNESALFISRYRVYKFFNVLSGWGRGGIPEKTLKLVSIKTFSQEQ